MKPTTAEAYLTRVELAPFSLKHALHEIWEETVGPTIDRYLRQMQVQCTILHPLQIGTAGQPTSPVIMVGVNPGTLSPRLASTLLFIAEASLSKVPAASADPTAIVREPFSTTLGLPICNAKTHYLEGTGSFFFLDSAKPGILYLLAPRHALFDTNKEENKPYQFRETSGEARKKVMFMGEAAFHARCDAVKSEIATVQILIDHYEKRLKAADAWEDHKAAEAERKLLSDVVRDWTNEENRIIGHVTLSPPISSDCGDDGFTEDWAVVEIYPSMISKLNFVGNAIDLGSVAVDKLTRWMSAHPSSFEYPTDRLLRFSGTASDREMFKSDPETKDHGGDPVLMVMKNGNTESDLTVGRLNTIRAFVREYSNGKPGQMTKEMAILPRSSKSGSFSASGDSGAVAVDGTGRVCGTIIGGDGSSDVSDCTFVTSIDFLIKRLAAFDIEANIFPHL
ncbi:hypothetical protein BDP27DRAFT_1445130 [Rhodocollybia butyracea]|uniref:Uncharacterized protein n=1 Tax=Rhodocollybia butyracea TaxID=206335 RepID=A0A9P5Q1N7_9AGAR|nr:hypothetical protein BDP27DRAFT_1445130 [Rhodocollybia butyracea]